MDREHPITHCRICQSPRVAPFVEVPSEPYPNTMCRYAVCNDCDTVLDDGSPPFDYVQSMEESPASEQTYQTKDVRAFNALLLRWYVEVGAGIDSMTRAIVALASMHSSRSGERPRFLDVGACFGFACSMAQFQGWETVGVEPSYTGIAGAHFLGVPILNKFLEQTDLPRNHFDFVHSSEVIEHVPDVDKFVATVAAYLKPDGILLLTSPNGQAVRGRDAVEREWMEALSPGYHINLFSPRSMEMVLRRNGMAAVQIQVNGGTSGRKQIIALASRSPRPLPLLSVPWQQLESKSFVCSYLQHLIAQREQAGKEDFVYRGVLFRLIEMLVNFGAYAEAETIISKLDRALGNAGIVADDWGRIQAGNLQEYVVQAPAFAGLYAFYKGMVCLNYRADYGQAVQWFRLAQGLCTIEQTIPYFPRLYWPARCQFHAGLALLYGGQVRDALREFDALLASDPRQLPQEMRDLLLKNKIRARHELGADFSRLEHLGRQLRHCAASLLPLAQIGRFGRRLLYGGTRAGARIARAAVSLAAGEKKAPPLCGQKQASKDRSSAA